MKKRIADIGLKRFTSKGKRYITHAYINWSIKLTEEDAKLTDRGLVLKYFPNWKESF